MFPTSSKTYSQQIFSVNAVVVAPTELICSDPLIIIKHPSKNPSLPPSSPKFEISTSSVNLRIYSIQVIFNLLPTKQKMSFHLC